MDCHFQTEMFKLVFLLALAPLTLAAPTTLTEVRELVEAAASDVSSLAVAKAAAVGFAGGVAVNGVSMQAETAFKAAVDSSNTAIDFAADAGDAAVKYVSELDPIEVINKTEVAILEKNAAVIGNVFEAKRQAVEVLKSLTGQHAAAISAFVNGTVEGLNSALETTQEGISLSKQTVANLAAELTVENAQHGINTAQTAVSDGIASAQFVISDAFNATLQVVEQTGSALINSIIEAKQHLQNSAENFDSKETLNATKVGIGKVVVGSVEEAGKYVEAAGVFSAIDNLVHSLAGIPSKINSFLQSAKVEIDLSLEEAADDYDVNDDEEESSDEDVNEEEETVDDEENVDDGDDGDIPESRSDEPTVREEMQVEENEEQAETPKARNAAEYSEEELIEMLNKVVGKNSV